MPQPTDKNLLLDLSHKSLGIMNLQWFYSCSSLQPVSDSARRCILESRRSVFRVKTGAFYGQERVARNSSANPIHTHFADTPERGDTSEIADELMVALKCTWSLEPTISIRFHLILMTLICSQENQCWTTSTSKNARKTVLNASILNSSDQNRFQCDFWTKFRVLFHVDCRVHPSRNLEVYTPAFGVFRLHCSAPSITPRKRAGLKPRSTKLLEEIFWSCYVKLQYLYSHSVLLQDLVLVTPNAHSGPSKASLPRVTADATGIPASTLPHPSELRFTPRFPDVSITPVGTHLATAILSRSPETTDANTVTLTTRGCWFGLVKSCVKVNWSRKLVRRVIAPDHTCTSRFASLARFAAQWRTYQARGSCWHNIADAAKV